MHEETNMTEYEEMYDSITRKLGCRPEDYNPVYTDTECDNHENPLQKLSIEELEFIINNKLV